MNTQNTSAGLKISHRSNTCISADRRRGAVAVEFAIVVPIAFLFFFAAFEFCRVSMIRHTVDNAVYEACRRGIIPGGTSNEVEQTAQQILATMGVGDAEITVSPTNIVRDSPEVSLTITVDLDANSLVPAQIFAGSRLT
ncbi:MAG: TadE family protein, partial [Planctomycetota bacterium]